MENLPLALTHSLSTINQLCKTYGDVMNESKKVYSKIKSFDKDSDEYSSDVREETNEFVKEYGKKKYEKTKIDHDLIIDDLNLIIKNRHDDTVIYNFQKFNSYYKTLKKIKKKFKWNISDLEDDEKYYLFDEDFVMVSNTHKIISTLKKYQILLDVEFDKIEKFSTVVKKEDDEDDD